MSVRVNTADLQTLPHRCLIPAWNKDKVISSQNRLMESNSRSKQSNFQHKTLHVNLSSLCQLIERTDLCQNFEKTRPGSLNLCSMNTEMSNAVFLTWNVGLQ